MILICDDDTTVRTSLTLVLKRAGYEVATAANQQEAIDFVRHTCPQLILMDMNYSKHNDRGRRTGTACQSTGILPGSPGYPDHGLGFHQPRCPRHTCRCFRFYHETVEQPGFAENNRNSHTTQGQRRKNPDPKNGKTERTDRFDKIIGRSPPSATGFKYNLTHQPDECPCADHRRKRHW